LHKRCGVEVSLVMKSETGRVIEFHSHPNTTRTCEIQVNTLSSVITAKKRMLSNSTHTPKKKKLQPKRDTPPILKCTNLLGKKKKISPPAKRKISNKCKCCKVIWKSKADMEYRKKYGMRMTSWIGCDHINCKYWAHASCAKLLLVPGKSIKNHNFMCPVVCKDCIFSESYFFKAIFLKLYFCYIFCIFVVLYIESF